MYSPGGYAWYKALDCRAGAFDIASTEVCSFPTTLVAVHTFTEPIRRVNR